MQTFAEPLALLEAKERVRRELWPRFLPTKARFGGAAEVRQSKSDAGLHASVHTRFAATSVPQYDERSPYQPENLRGHLSTKS